MSLYPRRALAEGAPEGRLPESSGAMHPRLRRPFARRFLIVGTATAGGVRAPALQRRTATTQRHRPERGPVSPLIAAPTYPAPGR